jgi:N-acetylglucosaminyldiphosphoundecaprenol N-acetyl-beta-D-mannosaminyltransferase
MIDRGKRSVLGVGIDVVDYEAAVAKVLAAARERRSFTVSALAVHGVMTGLADTAHRYRLNRLDLVVPDGQPLRWALRLLHGERLRTRVYGPKLTLLVCEAAAEAGIPVHLYGSTPETLGKLEANLARLFPTLRISGCAPSQFGRAAEAENEEIMRSIREAGAGIVLVGLGCPRQEVFLFENARALSCAVLAVGAAFDFVAGTVPQAPTWMGDRGLEWLFRLLHEPRRLWRRYLLLNPLFCWNVARQWLAPARFRPDEDLPPNASERYV